MDSPVLHGTEGPKGLFVLSKGSFTGTHFESYPTDMKRNDYALALRIMGTYWKNWWKPRQDQGEMKSLRSENLPNISNGHIASTMCHTRERHMEQMVLALLATLVCAVLIALSLYKSKESATELHTTITLLLLCLGAFAWISIVRFRKFNKSNVSDYTLRVAGAWREFFHDTLQVSELEDEIAKWSSTLSDEQYMELYSAAVTEIPKNVGEKVRELAYKSAVGEMILVQYAETHFRQEMRNNHDKKLNALISILMMTEKSQYGEIRQKIFDEAKQGS